jgi:hypothetical protein
MTTRNLMCLSAAAGLMLMAAACSNDATSPKVTTSTSLIDQTTLTNDVASSAGDAIALDVSSIVGNETAANLGGSAGAPAAATTDSTSYTRSRTCFDASGTAVACRPLSNVREIVTVWSFEGVRSGTTDNGATFSGDMTRAAVDTLFRNFTDTTETSRTHDGVVTGTDTVTFVGPNVTRTHDQSAVDSVEAVTWNVPRYNNPFPVSGKIVRNVSVHATYTSATRSDTTDVQKRVEVDFPADAQGNVVLKIDDKTCNLNLVTRHVSDCQ